MSAGQIIITLLLALFAVLMIVVKKEPDFSDPLPEDPKKERPPELGIQLAESIHRYRMENDEIR